MKILAFDSTAKSASAAVLENDSVIAVYTVDNGLTQSELLLPMAEDMLRALKLTFSDIELFAASVGPGSFTGVRIGVSLVKGLAFGRNIPCSAVSTLEALAENLSGIDGIIVPVMDARREQVYCALFDSKENELKRLTPDAAMAISELGEALKNFADRKIYLVGDGYDVARPKLFSLGVGTEVTPLLLRLENAASVGKIAYEKYKRGETVSDLEIAPTYLRMPQAERERLEREAATKQGN